MQLVFAEGEVLLTDSGFESTDVLSQGSKAWTFSGDGNAWYGYGSPVPSVTSETAHTGTYSAAVSNGAVGQRVKLEGGKKYKLSVYICPTQAYATGTSIDFLPSFYDKFAQDGVNMVRIDWIFADIFYEIVSRNESGELEYNFEYLDKTIIPLLEKGMKPYITLDRIPQALGGTSVLGLNYSGIDNLTEYGEIITAVVKHYADMGYTGWYWESHNEPDNSYEDISITDGVSCISDGSSIITDKEVRVLKAVYDKNGVLGDVKIENGTQFDIKNISAQTVVICVDK